MSRFSHLLVGERCLSYVVVEQGEYILRVFVWVRGRADVGYPGKLSHRKQTFLCVDLEWREESILSSDRKALVEGGVLRWFQYAD